MSKVRVQASCSASQTSAYPIGLAFAQWGQDMVGKMQKSCLGGHVYLLVVVDKFTKWIEATPVTTQDSTAAVNFIKSIVFRFGVPNSDKGCPDLLSEHRIDGDDGDEDN
jgi:hypothetical protein